MKNAKASVNEEIKTIATLSWLYGRQYERTKADIERFAESIGAIGSETTRGMGALLYGAKEIWEVLRPSNSVLVRRTSTKGNKKKRRRVEVDNSPRKKSLTSGVKGFKYNGKHWMQKPENKARVVAMMRARNKKRNKKAA